MVGDKILVKKKDPPVGPEFWYGREQNSGEKKTPSVATVGRPAENNLLLYVILSIQSVAFQQSIFKPTLEI